MSPRRKANPGVQNSRPDVVVIGGGLSGLAAAVELASRGASVVLCEQAPRLGGRCYSYVDRKTGDVIDNGQHLLVGANLNVLGYLERTGARAYLRKRREAGLPLHHPVRGTAAFEIPSIRQPIRLARGMFKSKLLTLRDMRRLMNVASALNGLDPHSERLLASLTVEQWLTSLDQSEEARNCLWYPLAVSVMNDLPGRSCALLFARALKLSLMGAKSDSSILLPSVGQSELYVDGATAYLEARKSKLLRNTQVKTLEMKESGVSAVVLSDGTRIRPAWVISTVPYFSLERLIPRKLKREKPFVGLGEIESSPIVSFHFWFDRDFMDVDFLGLIGRRIQWVFNRRRIMGGNEKQTGYVSAVISGARGYVDLSGAVLRAIALEDLRTAFPLMVGSKLLHSIIIKEKRATFSPTCDVESLRPSPETPVRNFFLGGDWTNTGLPATLEGAVISGYAAAARIR
jgi:zeta-carotene desaturase